MPALLIGSISALADTSELQRNAFNQAFAEHDLGWEWQRDDYRDRLTGNGGADRIAAYAAERGEEVDAARVHATKSLVFQEWLAEGGMVARPGVVDTIAAARAEGWQVGLVTTTSRGNVDALLSGLPDVTSDDFDLITDVTTVEDAKPDPAIYRHALEVLGEDTGGVVAVEDNVGGVRAAAAAGIACLALPNENTADHDFGDATVLDKLTFDDVCAVAGRAR